MQEKNLRPHHLYCIKFVDFKNPSRGSKFNDAIDEAEQILESETKQSIRITEGPDAICSQCPFCSHGACQHPEGDEQEVRKWDVKILTGLGLRYGKVITNKELRKLIKQVRPLSFCIQKCRYSKLGLCSEKETNQT